MSDLQPSTGRWRVETENSMYLVDLDEMTVRRNSDVHSLRWDDEVLKLKEVPQGMIPGGRMSMMVNPRVDDDGNEVWAWRYTSFVLNVEDDTE